MSTIEVKIPVFAESITEGSIDVWYKQTGDPVKEGEKLLDVETDKIVLEVVSPCEGVLNAILKQAGETVFSQETVATVEAGALPTFNTSPKEEPSPPQTEGMKPLETIPGAPAPIVEPTPAVETVEPKTSPAVRKMAASQQIDVNTVPHQGDRVTKTDMLAHAESQKQASPPPNLPPVTPPVIAPIESPVGNDPFGRPEERVPMSRLRKRTAERLLAAQYHHAILTTFNEVNMKPLKDLRTKYGEKFEKEHGVRLGFMSLFAKAAVAALQKFPIVNASTDGEDIIYHGYYDIGIAVSSPRGLVVPILRDVDTLSPAEIEKAIADYAKRAKNAQLTIEDLTGGTFTITNGGIFGSMLSTPILNPPQSGILGMHNIVDRPVVENGEIVIRPIMYVALSYDHRIIDGREAVQFLVTIKNAIEDPARLLLNI